MRDAILTLNAGSSSLKFAVFDSVARVRHATGLVDRIGPEAKVGIDGPDGPILTESLPLADHAAALAHVLGALTRALPDLHVAAVGHRIVHGGTAHITPEVLTDGVLRELAALSPFAPLHQPHNLAAVAAARTRFPDAVQIGCFDTAFHRTHPFVADTFALPREFYEQGVRRYGFHGLSYDYITRTLAMRYPHLHAGRVLVAHLGSGASMCAIKGGQSIASSMGFSALDGLPMGTRCGQIDPGVLLYLMAQRNMSPAAIEDLLYRRSGLLGMSGESNDMRTLLASENPAAVEAIDYFVFRVRREVGALATTMGGIDALVFTGGIGEHAAILRDRICEGLGWMGIGTDPARNIAHAADIGRDDLPVRVLVIPTDEEAVIADACANALSAGAL